MQFLAVGLVFGFLNFASAATVSITFDDFNINDSVLLTGEQRNEKILNALDAQDVHATLFVQVNYVESLSGKALLGQWDARGHQIANHTYSNLDYHSSEVSFEEFSQDFLKAEEQIKFLFNFEKLFRFPYFHEGPTSEKRDQIRAFLKYHRYQMGYVTIDTSDWYIDERMKKRLKENPKADLTGYREYFLQHIWERAIYYHILSKRVLGRDVRHTLLLHYNLLNALYLEDLIAMFKAKGWHLISSKRAFADPVFKMEPKIVPAGNSIIWALAKEGGLYRNALRDPAEGATYEKEAMDRLGL